MKTTFLKALVFVLGFTAVFSSCDKNEEVLNAQNTEQKQVINPLTAAEGTATSELRSTSTYANGEEAYPSEGEKGTNFFFKFRGAPIDMFNQITVQIRFHAPNGGTYTFDMDPVGEENGEAIFEFERELSLIGTYSFEYGYSLRGSNFTAFNGTFFVKVTGGELDPIPVEDDYDSSNDSGYANKYCTAWVAWKVNQIWGTYNAFPSHMGNASEWGEQLSNRGYKKDLNPKVGDIVWYEANVNGIGAKGHVAFVNEVINNDHVIITEYNYTTRNPETTKPKQHNKRPIYRNGGPGHRFPSAFIHVQNQL